MERLESLKAHFTNEPFAKFLKATLDVLKYGYAVVSAPVSENFLIVDGIVQGGVITAVADFAGVYASMSTLSEGHTPAAQINIHFLRPIGRDGIIQAVGQVENESRSAMLVAVNVYGSDQKRKAY